MESKLRAKWNDDIDRRLLTAKALDYYANNQEYYLKERLQENYPNSYSDMIPYLDYINFTETVINQLSLLFDTAPSITLIDSEKFQEKFEELADDSMLVPTLQKVNELTNLTNKVGVIPHWDDGRIDLEILTADKVFVEQDEVNPKRAIAVWIQVGITTNDPTKLDSVVEYIRWTPELQERYEVNNNNFGSPKLLDSQPNPYGEIPVVWFANDIEIDSFWFDSENYLVNKNEIFNQDLSALRFGAALQSFSTLVLDGLETKDTIKMGVHRPIVIPPSRSGDEQGSAYYITPDSDLGKIYDYIDRRIIATINSYGISASSYRADASSFSSGYQLKLSKMDVVQKNESDRVYYIRPVKDICRLMMKCYTLYHNSKQFPEEINIKVDFAEIDYQTDPVNQEQLNTMKLSNGTTSIPRILQKENPDLSLDEAKELHNEIKAENQEFGIEEIEGVNVED